MAQSENLPSGDAPRRSRRRIGRRRGRGSPGAPQRLQASAGHGDSPIMSHDVDQRIDVRGLQNTVVGRDITDSVITNVENRFELTTAEAMVAAARQVAPPTTYTLPPPPADFTGREEE